MASIIIVVSFFLIIESPYYNDKLGNDHKATRLSKPHVSSKRLFAVDDDGEAFGIAA